VIGRAGAEGFAGWRKPARSHAANGCVEVGAAPGAVGVRDSKLGPTSPILTFTPAQWRTFLHTLRTRTPHP